MLPYEPEFRLGQYDDDDEDDDDDEEDEEAYAHFFTDYAAAQDGTGEVLPEAEQYDLIWSDDEVRASSHP